MTVYGGASGHDTIWAGSGGTFQGGTAGHNVLIAQTPGTTLMGAGDGDEMFDNAGGGVTFVGGPGTEQMVASWSKGPDKFFGGTGTSVMWGGAGNDTLVSGAGMAYMTGGGGADLFCFNSDPSHAHAAVNITDFVPGVDHIGLYGYGGNAIADVVAHQENSAGGTGFSLGDGTHVWVAGVGHLDASMFVS
jgi:Ca2+-binding RTX toxin-like protein